MLPLLTPEELDRFRIEYGEDAIAELEQVVEDCSPANNKVIFAGHRGCGKSTLLAEFSRRLEMAEDEKYFVVFFSIADLIEMSDVNHITILFAIAVQLVEKNINRRINIKPSTQEALERWFANRTRIEIKTPVKADVSAGFDLFGIIKGKLKTDSTIREEIKQTFTHNLPDLMDQIDEIAAIIQVTTHLDILVIIDDLDKLGLAQVCNIYQEHVKALFQPKFRLIFTIPIALLREMPLRSRLETETNTQIKFLRAAKLFATGANRDPAVAANAAPLDTFQQILDKRLSPDLIDPDTARQIAFNSGGVLRELIRIANECCSHCLLRLRRKTPPDQLIINPKILDTALNRLRNDFATPLNRIHDQILSTLYEKFLPNNTSQTEEQKFLDLLHGPYSLEYRNCEIWYDVGPWSLNCSTVRARNQFVVSPSVLPDSRIRATSFSTNQRRPRSQQTRVGLKPRLRTCL